MEKIYDKCLAAYINFKHDESGATLVEYGIAITLAIVVGGALLTQLAGAINTNIGDAAGAMAVRPTD